MDAISLLKDDHQTVERLFKRFEKTSDRATVERRRIVDEIIKELSIHAEIEETIFYPAVRQAVPPSEEMVLESLEEHHVVKWVLSELEGMAPDAERFEAKVTVLIENVRHHVEEEESDLFPKVRRALTRTALDNMGEAMARAKTIAPTRPHPRSPDTPPGNIVTGVVAAALDRARDAGQELVEGAAGAARRVAANVADGGSPDQPPTRRRKAAAKRTTARKTSARRTAKKATRSAKKTARSASRSTKAGARKAARATKRTTKQASGTAKRTTKQASGTARRTTKQASGTAKRTTKQASGTAKRTAKKATGTTKKASRTAKGTAKSTAKKATGTTKKATRTAKSTGRRATSRPRKAAKKRSS
jgi:hemerythrin superfamily protein